MPFADEMRGRSHLATGPDPREREPWFRQLDPDAQAVVRERLVTGSLVVVAVQGIGWSVGWIHGAALPLGAIVAACSSWWVGERRGVAPRELRLHTSAGSRAPEARC